MNNNRCVSWANRQDRCYQKRHFLVIAGIHEILCPPPPHYMSDFRQPKPAWCVQPSKALSHELFGARVLCPSVLIFLRIASRLSIGIIFQSLFFSSLLDAASVNHLETVSTNRGISGTDLRFSIGHIKNRFLILAPDQNRFGENDNGAVQVTFFFRLLYVSKCIKSHKLN